MATLILREDDGTEVEFINFVAVSAVEVEGGVEFRKFMGYDCRILTVGTMLKKAMIYVDECNEELIKEHHLDEFLHEPDFDYMKRRIHYSSS